jgi:hypothetical protein
MHWYIIFLSIFISPAVKAGDSVEYQYDTTLFRTPDKAFFELFRAEKDFDYGAPEKAQLKDNWFRSLLQGLWKVISKYFREVFKVLSALPVFFLIMLIMLLIASVLVISTRTRVYRLFYGDKRIDAPEFSELDALDEKLDFDEAIRNAVEKRNYRMAIRLLYIKILRALEDKELITYKKEKTGKEYCEELRDKSLSGELARLTMVYYRIWYGNHDPAEDVYMKLAPDFYKYYSGLYVS